MDDLLVGNNRVIQLLRLRPRVRVRRSISVQGQRLLVCRVVSLARARVGRGEKTGPWKVSCTAEAVLESLMLVVLLLSLLHRLLLLATEREDRKSKKRLGIKMKT